jgi:tRNA nucleotidyltransferase (CCA-adding enzyme)
LGLESDDIDIALDDMMGEDFANMIKAFMEERGEKVKGFGVIRANPEKSKHLETATITIYGYSTA